MRSAAGAIYGMLPLPLASRGRPLRSQTRSRVYQGCLTRTQDLTPPTPQQRAALCGRRLGACRAWPHPAAALLWMARMTIVAAQRMTSGGVMANLMPLRRGDTRC